MTRSQDIAAIRPDEAGLVSSEREHLTEFEKESHQFRTACPIPRAAVAFVGAELEHRLQE